MPLEPISFRRRVAVVIVFAVAGPLVGYAALFHSQAGPAATVVSIHFLFVPGLLWWPYLIGGPPSLAAGLAAALATFTRSGLAYVLGATAAGYAAAALWMPTLATLGAATGAICAGATLPLAGLRVTSAAVPDQLRRLRAGDVLLGAVIAAIAVIFFTLLLPAL